MSINLTDIQFQSLVKQMFAPALFEEDAIGISVDFNNGISTVYLITSLATMTNGWSIKTYIEESDDESSWTKINESEKTFTTQGLFFQSCRRTKRYLRSQISSITGTPTLAILAIQAIGS